MRFHKSRQAFSIPAVPVVETVIPNSKLKLLDQISEVMRLKHYSIGTEQTYSDWVRRFVQFHQMQGQEERLPARGLSERVGGQGPGGCFDPEPGVRGS